MDGSDRDRSRERADAGRGRERLDSDLVARVLKGFGLPTPTRIRTIERGSRRAPKVVVECPEGVFFLKRRRPGAVEAARFTAQLQRRLAASGCPVPAVRSTLDGEAVLEHEGHVFELVEFVVGDRYPRHPAAAASAGRTLGRLHEEMRNLAVPDRLRGSYHDSSLVREVIARLPGPEAEALLDREMLSDRYEHAAEVVRRWGAGRPVRLVHGDYHPGNLIHAPDADGRVQAVLDWEAIRADQPQIEFAAAAVHFSLPPSAVDSGRAGLDESLLTAFSGGFGPLHRDTAEVVPDLMLESVVAETAFLLDGGVRRDRAERLAGTVSGLIAWIDRHRLAISRIVRGESAR